MTIDATEAAHRIVECLSDDRVVLPNTAMNALLRATATTILMFAKDDPDALAEKFGELLTEMVQQSAIDFPATFKAGMLQ